MVLLLGLHFLHYSGYGLFVQYQKHASASKPTEINDKSKVVQSLYIYTRSAIDRALAKSFNPASISDRGRASRIVQQTGLEDSIILMQLIFADMASSQLIAQS